MTQFIQYLVGEGGCIRTVKDSAINVHLIVEFMRFLKPLSPNNAVFVRFKLVRVS